MHRVDLGRLCPSPTWPARPRRPLGICKDIVVLLALARISSSERRSSLLKDVKTRTTAAIKIMVSTLCSVFVYHPSENREVDRFDEVPIALSFSRLLPIALLTPTG